MRTCQGGIRGGRVHGWCWVGGQLSELSGGRVGAPTARAQLWAIHARVSGKETGSHTGRHGQRRTYKLWRFAAAQPWQAVGQPVANLT